MAVGLLSVEFVAGMLLLTLFRAPQGTEPPFWSATGITGAIHGLLGLAILIGSIFIVVNAARRNRILLSRAVLGFLGVVASVGGGLAFGSIHGSVWLFTMSVGFIVALLSYGSMYAVAKANGLE